MKKTISMMLAVVLCMGLFTGCGNGSKAPKEVTEIVEGINKDIMESRETSKEGFELTETFTSDDKTYFVYESNGIDDYKNVGKEYKTTLKFMCKSNEVIGISVKRNQDYGLNLRTAEMYIKKIDKFKITNDDTNSSEYKKE